MYEKTNFDSAMVSLIRRGANVAKRARQGRLLGVESEILIAQLLGLVEEDNREGGKGPDRSCDTVGGHEGPNWSRNTVGS